MAVGLQRSGDWPAARRIGRRPITARCTAVGLLPLLREEFGLFKLIWFDLIWFDFALGIAATGGLTSGFALPI